MPEQRKLNEIIFRDDLYPRLKTSPQTVQKYAEDLEILSPIEVNQHNELIDGWHRWTAHKKNEADTVSVIVTQTTSDMHVLELAIKRNAKHGLQLSNADKQSQARGIYHITSNGERPAKKKHLAELLSVSEKTIKRWVSRIDKDAKAERNKEILEMWMACYTHKEIADTVGVDKKTVSNFVDLGKNGQMSKIPQTPQALHQTKFKPPIYNIWKQQTKSQGVGHFGNSEVTWVDNLLYLYTQPLDIVVDPFAGGGSTIDICKTRSRRYWVSDRKPIVEREKEIRNHDITDGLPPLPRWKDVKLVYLDPPYWIQAQNKYSKDPQDLANMSLDDFHNTLRGLIIAFSKKLTDAYIALIIQPTQWKSPNRQYIDHITEVISRVPLPLDMRYSVPYESQQANAQMVKWSKENKKCLVLTRELIVWKVQ